MRLGFSSVGEVSVYCCFGLRFACVVLCIVLVRLLFGLVFSLLWLVFIGAGFWVKSVTLRLVICVLAWCCVDWLVLYCFCYSMWGVVLICFLCVVFGFCFTFGHCLLLFG